MLIPPSRVGQLVHSPALRALSGKDRKFLEAMAVDDGASWFADLIQRLVINAGVSE